MTSEPELVWRRATVEDAETIAELEKTIFEDTAWPLTMVRDELAGPYRAYTVVTRADEIVAYGGALAVGGDGDIQTIAVTESLRGTGVGRALLDQLMRDAHELGANRVFLEVRADNPVAIGMYERSGFEHIGVRRGYYQPGNIDALIMCHTKAQEATE